MERITKNITEHGRHLQAIPMEDKNGEVRTDKNGKPLVSFVYTIGNAIRCQPELLTFYPSMKTDGFVLNALSELLEEGTVPTPTGRQIVNVEGLLPVDIIVYPLNKEQQEYADDEFTCQGFTGAPTLLVSIPAPDGNFLPVTPDKFMPNLDDGFEMLEAKVD